MTAHGQYAPGLANVAQVRKDRGPNGEDRPPLHFHGRCRLAHFVSMYWMGFSPPSPLDASLAPRP
jgi:hypothetical protein